MGLLFKIGVQKIHLTPLYTLYIYYFTQNLKLDLCLVLINDKH